MTDYSDMTDDEINRFVTLALGYVRDDGLESEWYYDPKGESHDSDMRGPLRKIKNYCNDWAAIGPIIEKYEINLDYDGCMKGWWSSSRNLSGAKISEHKSPKRCAAICFLMMQEAKDG